MYRYIIEIHSEEHMLYSKEIALIYGFLTVKGHQHTRMVNAIIEEYRIIQKMPAHLVVFFETAWGPQRVWPFEVYDPAMRWFRQTVERTGTTKYAFSDGKSFNFKLVAPQINISKPLTSEPVVDYPNS